jgi:predicted DNA-binding ribbon-helix-helix protein
MTVFDEKDTFLSHMFTACTTDQINEFIPEKRGFRIHGHSTTLRLESAFWTVLEEMASEENLTLGELIINIHDTCLIANDKNLASCLRVICLKYLNLYA